MKTKISIGRRKKNACGGKTVQLICHKTGCLGDKGKCSDSLLLSKRLSEDSSCHQVLQKSTNMWRSTSEDASVANKEKARLEEVEAAEERLLVFLCSSCWRQKDTNCILLHCVSCNVSVGKEQKLSTCEKENGCILETLYCTGCSLNLGYVYRCTPKNLDYKRDLFCLSIEAIKSYVLGSSEKQIVSEDKELFNLESRVEIEKSLKQMEDVLQKISEVEDQLNEIK
uniref:Protein Mis18-alpha n=1 Tax=Callithrix jacchus TaxID=9483 RepID=A0A5F4VR37_CALJA